MALDKNKTDLALGRAVHEHLKSMGVETPMVRLIKEEDTLRGDSEKLFSLLHHNLGLDLTDESLMETPRRLAKMYHSELFWGLDYKNFPKIMTIGNSMEYGSMVLERGISVKSMCEHHWMPIRGQAYVAYIPEGKVIGLSKLNRVVEFFCRRPQVQERLVEQIYHTLSYLLGTENVAVVIKAEHFCVSFRGKEDEGGDTLTSKLGGVFFNGPLRAEFLQAIKI